MSEISSQQVTNVDLICSQVTYSVTILTMAKHLISKPLVLAKYSRWKLCKQGEEQTQIINQHSLHFKDDSGSLDYTNAVSLQLQQKVSQPHKQLLNDWAEEHPWQRHSEKEDAMLKFNKHMHITFLNICSHGDVCYVLATTFLKVVTPWQPWLVP